jgi:hypothetical protein
MSIIKFKSWHDIINNLRNRQHNLSESLISHGGKYEEDSLLG